MLVPILLATSSWRLPLLRNFEAQAFDWYSAALAPRLPPRPDIVVLTFDEATAREYAQFSPTPKRLIAAALRNLDDLGARAIGIDVGMTVRTDDAPELAQVLSGLRTRTAVAYADPEFDQAMYWSAEADFDARSAQAEFWAQVRNPNIRQATPVVSLDPDGVRRRWPQLPSTLRRPLSSEMIADEGYGAGYQGSIDYIVGAETEDAGSGVFDTIPLSTFADPESAAALADLVRGRYVLIGIDLENVDQATVPVFPGDDNTVSGVFIHAQLLAQALDGRLRPAVPTVLIVIVLLLVIAGGAATAVVARQPWLLVLLSLLQISAVLALPLVVQHLGYDRISLPLVGIGVSWLTALLCALFLVRRSADARTRFAQGALGKYLPKTVASEILKDPTKLDLTGQRRRLFIMFTDLESFTRFSHDLDPQVVAELLNDYLDLVSSIVLRHEGTLDKYVGDAVIAFWGAPLVNDQDANNAFRCVLEIAAETESFRARWKSRGLSLGRTRIGLHHGEVIVGNFGGADRIQYTAIGDAVNTASRLESLNKQLGSQLLVSGEAARLISLDRFMPLGRVKVSGRPAALELYQPLTDGEASLADQVRSAYAKYEQGDESAAALIARLAADREDRVLASFAQRLQSHQPGDAYAFQEK